MANNKNKIDEMVSELAAVCTEAEVQLGFVRHDEDVEFELKQIGYKVLAGHDIYSLPVHIFVWAGYEQVKYGGPYTPPGRDEEDEDER